MGTATEGLIFKALARTGRAYQQSYQQKFWSRVKALKNQALTFNFKKIDKT